MANPESQLEPSCRLSVRLTSRTCLRHPASFSNIQLSHDTQTCEGKASHAVPSEGGRGGRGAPSHLPPPPPLSLLFTFHPVHHLARGPFTDRFHNERHGGNFARSGVSSSETAKRKAGGGSSWPTSRGRVGGFEGLWGSYFSFLPVKARNGGERRKQQQQQQQRGCLGKEKKSSPSSHGSSPLACV